MFVKKSGLRRLWRVKKSQYSSHLSALECIFVEDLINEEYDHQLPSLHLTTQTTNPNQST